MAVFYLKAALVLNELETALNLFLGFLRLQVLFRNNFVRALKIIKAAVYARSIGNVSGNLDILGSMFEFVVLKSSI